MIRAFAYTDRTHLMAGARLIQEVASELSGPCALRRDSDESGIACLDRARRTGLLSAWSVGSGAPPSDGRLRDRAAGADFDATGRRCRCIGAAQPRSAVRGQRQDAGPEDRLRPLARQFCTWRERQNETGSRLCLAHVHRWGLDGRAKNMPRSSSCPAPLRFTTRRIRRSSWYTIRRSMIRLPLWHRLPAAAVAEEIRDQGARAALLSARADGPAIVWSDEAAGSAVRG